MVEEQKTEAADTEVSDETLKSIEKEIMTKDKAEKETLKTEIETELRAKIAEEQRVKELEENTKLLEKLVKKKDEEKTRTEEKLKAEIEKLKENSGSSKAVVDGNSPFTKDTKNDKPIDFDNMTREEIQAIDEESKIFFKKELKEKGQDMKGLTDW